MLPSGSLAAGLDGAIQTYAAKPTAANRAAALKAADKRSRALAALGVGLVDLDAGRYREAAEALAATRNGVPDLDDYVRYGLAAAQAGLGDQAAVVQTVQPIYLVKPVSLLAGKAAWLEARAWLDQNQPKKALEVVRLQGNLLKEPEREAIQGAAQRALGNLAQAAAHYQKIYYQYPVSAQAPEAAAALPALEEALGSKFPPAMPSTLLARAAVWFDAHDYARARDEYKTLTDKLAGRSREIARAQLAAASYHMGRTRPAYDYLQSQEFRDPEAAAQRLYYLAMACRRMGRDAEMLRYIDELSRYPKSPWRLRGLRDTGNSLLIQNDYAKYEKYFRTCHEAFAGDPDAAYCHWWAAWSAYVRQRPEGSKMLAEHIRIYPTSDKAPAALYFLGRTAEREKRPQDARAYYEQLTSRFASYYYAALGRERLNSSALQLVEAAPAIVQAVAAVAPSDREPPASLTPGPETAIRLERAHLLASMGLLDWAERELNFAVPRVEDRHLVAMELAQSAISSGDYQRALRQMKRLNPGYQSFALDSAPREYWELLYPYHYREDIEKEAREKGLDPFLVAGLIRQESEFNAGAVSRARARGLIQIMPSTGRSLCRQVKLSHCSTNLLLDPAANLKMGTHYLRTLIDSWNGRLEMALASYNAGKSRADTWITWADFREPAEFIETIPFSETRTYVQIVLGNAAIYRALYGGKASAIMASNDLHNRTVFSWHWATN